MALSLLLVVPLITAQQFNCTHDIPLYDVSCLQRYRDDHCGENWLNGYCCITCGDKSCLDECYDGDISNFPSDFNPYDCESDIAPNSDTCPESYSYQNCEEDWMNGYCCNSCPNACNCGSLTDSYYQQNNNNNNGGGGGGQYDKLSIEEIRKHENNFIALHWILSIFVLIIPILVTMYFYKNQEEFKQLLDVRHAHQSGSMEQIYCKLHISNWYQIITILCILLWYIRIIMEPIQIRSWQNDYEKTKDNAISYDTWKMFIYVFSKFLMYFLFILRIHFSFDGSVYAYPKKYILGLLIVLIFDFVLKIIANSIAISALSTDIIYRDDSNIAALVPVFVFLILEEVGFTIVLVFSFIRPLVKLTSTVFSSKILGIITKYAVLGCISIISSAIISILSVFFIGTDDLMVVWMTNLFISIDCVINSWCNLFLFSFTTSWYLFCCHFCDKTAKKIYENKLEKAGVNTDNDVHADRSMAKYKDNNNNMERTETLNNPTIKSTASGTTSGDDAHLTDGIRHSALTIDTDIDTGNGPQHRSLQTVASITAFETNNSMEQQIEEDDDNERIEDNDKEDEK